MRRYRGRDREKKAAAMKLLQNLRNRNSFQDNVRLIWLNIFMRADVFKIHKLSLIMIFVTAYTL